MGHFFVKDSIIAETNKAAVLPLQYSRFVLHVYRLRV